MKKAISRSLALSALALGAGAVTPKTVHADDAAVESSIMQAVYI